MSTFSVTNINDGGIGSLRQAILDANALSGKDIINFDGVFADNIADTITLAGSSLVLTDDLDIQGTNASLLTVSGNNASRVFEISTGVTVEIVGLSIANGQFSNPNNSTVPGGAGIYNSGILTVKDSSISNNRVSGSNGAGIYNSGTLTLNNSSISGNVGGGGFTVGGGIRNDGILSVNDSTVNQNSAYVGGGISNNGILTVNNSTINANSALPGAGPGIYNNGSISVSNSTISNNTGREGGGIYNTGSGTGTVSDSIIDNNRANSVVAGPIVGGGIYNSGTLTVNNTTIRNNSASNGLDDKLARGGGIENAGTLTINNGTISNNSVSARINNLFTQGGGINNRSTGILIVNKSTTTSNRGGTGAGISNEGTATISNSSINNHQVSSLGVIYNTGTLTISTNTFSNNLSSSIYNNGTTTVSNSTINNNGSTITTEGGGIYNLANLTVNNTTISNNNGQGGIFNNSGTATVSNSTITGNAGVGGIYNFINSTVTVKNSIIAGNFTGRDNSTRPRDVFGNFISNGYNLIGVLDDSTGFNASEQLNVPITSLLDTTLRDNGGSVQTHALVAGSPAIDAGNNADIPADITDLDGDGNTTEPVPFDGRGAGFPRISGARVDIGAYEVFVPITVINGTPGRDTINGTTDNDIITGFQGADTLTGGAGADKFAYKNIRDAGDTITDFEVGNDKIDLRQLFESFGVTNYNFTDAIANGYLGFKTQETNTIVLISRYASSSGGRAIKFITVNNVNADELNNTINFVV